MDIKVLAQALQSPFIIDLETESTFDNEYILYWTNLPMKTKGYSAPTRPNLEVTETSESELLDGCLQGQTNMKSNAFQNQRMVSCISN